MLRVLLQLLGCTSLVCLSSAGKGPSGWGLVVRGSVTNTSLDSLTALALGGTFEKEVGDGITLGGAYNYNSAKKIIPDKLIVDGTANVGGQTVDTKVTMGILSPLVALDLKTTLGKKTKMRAVVDSTSLVPESLELTRLLNIANSLTSKFNMKFNCRSGATICKAGTDLWDGALVSQVTMKDPMNWPKSKQNLELKLKFKYDDSRTLTPTLKPFSREHKLSYEYHQKLQSGSLKAHFVPGSTLTTEWQDPGLRGTWTTTLMVPIKDTSASSIGFKRTFSL